MNDLLTFLKMTYIGPLLLRSPRMPVRIIGAAIFGYNALVVYQNYMQNQQKPKGA